MRKADVVILFLCMETISCAMRGRPDGKRNRQNLELGTDVANAITSVQKDSLVCEIYGVYDDTESR